MSEPARDYQIRVKGHTPQAVLAVLLGTGITTWLPRKSVQLPEAVKFDEVMTVTIPNWLIAAEQRRLA